jgi:hypothetical protein
MGLVYSDLKPQNVILKKYYNDKENETFRKYCY